MHLQIRTRPARSPADLQAFLTVLADGGVNILAAGGGDVEGDGEFAIAVAHDTEGAVMTLLTDNGYSPRLVEVDVCWLDDRPGQLLSCITDVSLKNQSLNRSIKDLAIGGPQHGQIPVQVYSEDRSS